MIRPVIIAGFAATIAVIACFTGCSSANGQAAAAADIATADWLALDLSSRQIVAYQSLPSDLGNARWRTQLVLFRRISAGTTEIGRPISDPITDIDERPRRPSDLEQTWIAVFELSRSQWLRLGGSDGWLALDPGDGFQLPATGMSPEEAERTIASATPAGWRLSVPRPAEWEYACLAGRKTKLFWGDNLGGGASKPDPAQFACTLERQQALAAAPGPLPVGSLLPNPLGLFDMHGNVWEMVHDDTGWYARGGAWDQPVSQCRASNRMPIPADQPTYAVGVRLVLRR